MKLKQVYLYHSMLLLVLSIGSLTCRAEERNLSDGATTIKLSEIVSEVRAMPANIRETVLGGKAQLSKIVTQILVEKRITERAIKAGYLDNPVVKAKIDRATRLAIANTYIEDQYAKLKSEMPDISLLARERYEADSAAYTLPEAIRVAHILFNYNAEAGGGNEADVKTKAEQALEKLKLGADFKAMASELSDDPGSAKNGGELSGWMERGKLVPTFEHAAFALKPGELSGLVRTRYGFHIIKLLEYQQPIKRPFDEVSELIKERMKNELLTHEKDKIMGAFRSGKELVIPADLLDVVKAELKK